MNNDINTNKSGASLEMSLNGRPDSHTAPEPEAAIKERVWDEHGT